MRLPSASNLYRVFKCPESLVLPHVEDRGSDAARHGTEIHEVLAHQLDPTQPVPAPSQETKAFLGDLDIRPYFAGYTVVGCEVPFAYHVLTGEVEQLPPGDRTYRTSDTVIGGTADLILRAPDGSLLVVDFKTGMRVEPVEDNKQLLFFALCLSKLYPGASLAGRIVFIYEMKVTQQSAPFTATQVRLFELTLMRLMVALEEVNKRVSRGFAVTPTAGEWCKYCPSFSLCPAQRHLLAAALREEHEIQSVTPQYLFGLSPAEAGKVWQKLQEFKKLIEQLETEFKLFAQGSEICLEDGVILELKTRTRETLDADKARSLLKELYGDRVMERSSEFNVRKELVRAALKAEGKGTSELANFITRLSQRGGLQVSKYEVLQKSRIDDKYRK